MTKAHSNPEQKKDEEPLFSEEMKQRIENLGKKLDIVLGDNAELKAELREALQKQKEVSRKQDFHDSYDNFPYSPVSCCVVCSVPRLRGDPTGVTCGRRDCMAELGVIYRKDINFVKDKAGVSQHLLRISKMLGIPLMDYDNYSEFCYALVQEIERMKDLLNRLKKLDEDISSILDSEN